LDRRCRWVGRARRPAGVGKVVPCRSLVHTQRRFLVMRYSGSHETSNFRTFAFRQRARGAANSPALQRRFRSTPSPDTLGKLSRRTPATDSQELGMQSSQTVRNAIHDFNRRGLGALLAASSRPKQTPTPLSERKAPRRPSRNSCIVLLGSLAGRAPGGRLRW